MKTLVSKSTFRTAKTFSINLAAIGCTAVKSARAAKRERTLACKRLRRPSSTSSSSSVGVSA